MAGSGDPGLPRAFFTQIANASKNAYTSSAVREIRPRICNTIMTGVVAGIEQMISLRPEFSDAFHGSIDFNIACEGIASGRMWSILVPPSVEEKKHAGPAKHFPTLYMSSFSCHIDM